jgi:UDP-GlcNAc:undecaprenyl-phosphate GlcNAc-1-phosphate transferase
MFSSGYTLVFASGFVGCILATPVVTRLAGWAGAIDRPDKFRRIHKGAIPRLGGLAVAFGLGLACLVAYLSGLPEALDAWVDRSIEPLATILASLVVLVIGTCDDTRGMNPRPKLFGQAAAVLVLIAGGIRITHFSLLGVPFNLSSPMHFVVHGWPIVIDPPSTLVTLVWFLACMNIWNLIDGMDGLASGVGLLVSGTLMLVALRQGPAASSAGLAAALAGSLAGFLLYNWHPACIFLGDSGSLLIGLLIGVIGVQSSMKGTTTVSILFPILAMGLPISDTAMAIFRRWVRNLPLSSADRRHVHHLLIGLGLNPRQAAVMLYCFSGFLCGVVLLGVSLNNSVHGEFLALLVGLSGVLAFLLILMSRRDELASLLGDLETRRTRKQQERMGAKLTWETVQKIELCDSLDGIWAELERSASELGCEAIEVECRQGGRTILRKASGSSGALAASPARASFRLDCGDELRLDVALGQPVEAPVSNDIAFRSIHRLALAAGQRIERLTADASSDTVRPYLVASPDVVPEHVTIGPVETRHGRAWVGHGPQWLRRALAAPAPWTGGGDE